MFLYGKLFQLVEGVLFRLVDLYIVGCFFVSVFGLLFCLLVCFVMFGVYSFDWVGFGGNFEMSQRGFSLQTRPHKVAHENFIAVEGEKKDLAQSPCGIIQKVRKFRMSKSQTAPYFNSTGNVLYPDASKNELKRWKSEVGNRSFHRGRYEMSMLNLLGVSKSTIIVFNFQFFKTPKIGQKPTPTLHFPTSPTPTT